MELVEDYFKGWNDADDVIIHWSSVTTNILVKMDSL